MPDTEFDMHPDVLDALNPDELCDFCWQTGEYHEDCDCNTCKYRHDCGGVENHG